MKPWDRSDIKKAIRGTAEEFDKKCYNIKQSSNLITIASSLIDKAEGEKNIDKKIQLIREANSIEEQAIKADPEDLKGIKIMNDFIKRNNEWIIKIQKVGSVE